MRTVPCCVILSPFTNTAWILVQKQTEQIFAYLSVLNRVASGLSRAPCWPRESFLAQSNQQKLLLPRQATNSLAYKYNLCKNQPIVIKHTPLQNDYSTNSATSRWNIFIDFVYQHTTFLVKQASQFVNLSVYQSDLDKKKRKKLLDETSRMNFRKKNIKIIYKFAFHSQ